MFLWCSWMYCSTRRHARLLSCFNCIFVGDVAKACIRNLAYHSTIECSQQRIVVILLMLLRRVFGIGFVSFSIRLTISGINQRSSVAYHQLIGNTLIQNTLWLTRVMKWLGRLSHGSFVFACLASFYYHRDTCFVCGSECMVDLWSFCEFNVFWRMWLFEVRTYLTHKHTKGFKRVAHCCLLNVYLLRFDHATWYTCVCFDTYLISEAFV